MRNVCDYPGCVDGLVATRVIDSHRSTVRGIWKRCPGCAGSGLLDRPVDDLRMLQVVESLPETMDAVPRMETDMIRAMTLDDVAAMVRLAIETEMFPPDAADFLAGTARDTLAGRRPGAWDVAVLDGTVVGVAFVEPREATDRVWALTMLAVAPSVQGGGWGRRLVQHVETTLADREQRLLVIETSGTAAYERTRRFYVQCGYTAVARVPGYFQDGDDMVLFLKDLRE